MALDVDTSIALRSTSDLQRLVEAVLTAGEQDEADWIEWKGPLDLTKKDHCFHIVKSVLGMANRLPDRATRLTCEGLGYLVVGAEPGRLYGVSAVDPAQLDQAISPYLGGPDGPRFAPIYVPVQGKTVLVVTVEAPRAGDRIAKLRKEFPRYDPNGKIAGTYPNGTVWVRKSGRTVPADASDLDALERRLLAAPASSAELDVLILGDKPLSWFHAAGMSEVIAKWATGRRNAVIASARAEDRRRHPEHYTDEPDLSHITGRNIATALSHQNAEMQRAVTGLGAGMLMGEEDNRTLDEYIDEVDAWRERLIRVAAEALPGLYVAARHGVVAVHVHNPSDRYLPDVELKVHFDWERAKARHKMPMRTPLPAPPWPYGKRKPPPWTNAPIRPPLADLARASIPAVDAVARRTWVEDGSILIRHRCDDLRPHDYDDGDDVYVFLPERPADGILHGTWTATVRNADGVLTGNVDVPVADEPVDIRELLDTASKRR